MPEPELALFDFKDESLKSSSSSSSSELKSLDRKVFYAFWLVAVLTLLFCVAELLAAVILDSLTLLTDSFHNFSDLLAIYIAYYARKVSRRPKSLLMSFGWGRTSILGGLVNGVFLLGLCVFIFQEAVSELFNPPENTPERYEHEGVFYIVISITGLVVNLFCTFLMIRAGNADLLHGNHHHSHNHHHTNQHLSHANVSTVMNVGILDEESEMNRTLLDAPKLKMDPNILGIYLHYLGDSISSLFIVGVGIIIYFCNDKSWARFIDPLAGLAVCIIVFFLTWPLIRATLGYLLQRAPVNVEIELIRGQLLAIDGVHNIHALRMWEVNDDVSVASVHLLCAPGTNTINAIGKAAEILKGEEFTHITIQPEICAEDSCNADFCFTENNSDLGGININ